MSLKLQIRSLKIYLLWNDCRPLAKVYGKKESFILYVSNHVFDLGHLYSSNCGLNALHKIISLLKGKKIFHMIIQFWDICEKNMENEQWQINRKKKITVNIYIYIYIILILKFQQKKRRETVLTSEVKFMEMQRFKHCLMFYKYSLYYFRVLTILKSISPGFSYI